MGGSCCHTGYVVEENTLQEDAGSLPSGAKATAKDGHVIHSRLVVHRPGNIFDQYERHKQNLGNGKYGTVCKAYLKGDAAKKTYAIKNISRKSKERSDPQLQKEIYLQKSMDHPNIAKVFETYSDYHNYYLVLEMCDGGELFDRIQQLERFTEVQAASVMEQLLKAVKYMHSKSVCHRDLKPENMLLLTQDPLETNLIKVIDFGCSSDFANDTPMKTKSGSPFYIAPEVLQGRYGPGCDLWSCGCILYILLCGYPPFNARSVKGILDKVKRGKYEFPDQDWKSVSEEGKELVRCLLQFDASKRMDAVEAEKSTWVKDKAPNAKPEEAIQSGFGSRIKDFRSAEKFKKAALHVVAWNIDDKHIEDLRRAFQAADINGDGELCIDELTECFLKGGVGLPEELKSMINEMDTNGSGKVDYTEFLAATLDRKAYQREEIVWQAFRTFDRNGDGHISKCEMEKIFANEELHSLVGDDVIDQLMGEVDANGDGIITFDEFMVMLHDKGL